MKRLLHLVVAVSMFIAQMGLAAVACACPSSPAPVPSASAKVCPMSGEPGCQCCGSSSESSRVTIGKADSGCVLASVAHSHPAVMEIPGPVVAALVGIQTFDFPVPLVAVTVACQHLVVPRIRPPNTASHGLRAPPLG